MRCSVVVLTASVLLRMPITECLTQPTSSRLQNQSEARTPTSSASITIDEDEFIGPHDWNPSMNATHRALHGLSCRRQDECGDALVCLLSGTCGCPERAPVLLSDGDDIFCVSHSVALNPLKATLLSAVCLVLGVIIIGTLGYKRIHTPPRVKAAPAREDLTLALETRSVRSCDRQGENKEDASGEKESERGSESENTRSGLHSFSVSTSRNQGTATLHRQCALLTQGPAHLSAHKEERVRSVRQCTKHARTKVQSTKGRRSERSDSTTEISTRNSFVSEGPREEAVEASVQENMSACCEASSRVITRKTTLSQRRASAPSASKLMLSNHVNGRSHSNSGYRSQASVMLDHGTRQCMRKSESSCVCKKNTQALEITSADHPRPIASNKLIETERRERSHRKFKSENSGLSAPTQLQRLASDQLTPLPADGEQPEEIFPCCGPDCGHLHFYGPSVESTSSFAWRTESCMKLFTDQVRERENCPCLRTSSQPTWTGGHVPFKIPDRRARTCEAFAVHHDVTMYEVPQGSLLEPAAMRRVPRIVMENRTQRPSGDCSLIAPPIHMTSNAAQLTDAEVMGPWFHSLALLGTPNEPPTPRRRSTMDHIYQNTPHGTRGARAARFP